MKLRRLRLIRYHFCDRCSCATSPWLAVHKLDLAVEARMRARVAGDAIAFNMHLQVKHVLIAIGFDGMNVLHVAGSLTLLPKALA